MDSKKYNVSAETQLRAAGMVLVGQHGTILPLGSEARATAQQIKHAYEEARPGTPPNLFNPSDFRDVEYEAQKFLHTAEASHGDWDDFHGGGGGYDDYYYGDW